MRSRRFPKCDTCGTHGHAAGRDCPVDELNKQQEADAKLGLPPALEAEISRLRAKWRQEHATQPILVQPSQVQMSPGFDMATVARLRSHWRKTAFLVLVSLLLFVQRGSAGTISGQFQTATGGVIANGTLTFHLSQPMVIAGTAQVISQDTSCYTSTVGNIVGLPDPLILPAVTTNTASGTLAAGTYYIRITYYGAGGETYYSPETTTVLTGTGTLIINPPALQPPSATGYKVYIGATSGAETLQGTVSGWTQYSQTSALAAGTALPSSNTTVCSIHFSDEGMPTGTYYLVTLVNRNGSKLAGFPQTWCTYGGASGTINVSNGAPTGSCGTNGVFYPTPIFANPANNSLQSISGPLALPSGLSGTVPFFTLQSSSGNPAQSGVIRLSDGDTACWRSHSNTADVCISKNSSDQFVIPGTLIVSGLTSSGTVLAPSFVSSSANPASVGAFRLATADLLCWRNNANSANNCLQQDTDDSLITPKPLELTNGSAPTSVVSGVTWLWADLTDLFLHQKQPSQGGDQHIPIAMVVSPAYTNATTSFTTVSPWTITVGANRTYTFHCDVTFQGSATTAGPKFQLIGPASPGSVLLAVDGYTNSTAVASAAVTAFSTANTTLGTLGAGTTNFVAHLSGALVNGVNAGTMSIQAAANGAGTLTIQPGSTCVFQ